jgi:hypothetical protein
VPERATAGRPAGARSQQRPGSCRLAAARGRT